MTVTLQEFLLEELERSSIRDVAERIDMAPSALRRLAQGELKSLPEIETLQKIARAFKLPLWHVLKMAGVDLGLPDDSTTEVKQIASLFTNHEQFRELVSAAARADKEGVDAVLKYFKIHQVSNRAYETVHLFRQGMSDTTELLVEVARELDLPVNNRHVYRGERFYPTWPYQTPSLRFDGLPPDNTLLLNVIVDEKILADELGFRHLPDFEWGTTRAPLIVLAQAILDYEFREEKHAHLRRYARIFAHDVVGTLPREVGAIEWVLESREIILWMTVVKLCEQALGRSLAD